MEIPSLFEICQSRNLELLIFLIHIDPMDTLIRACIYNNFVEGLQYLLQQSPKCQKKHQDPHIDHIRYAVGHDQLECVQIFLDHGCDVDGDYGYYNEPPVLSLRSIEMAELLIAHGSDVNLCRDIPWDDGEFHHEGISLFGNICDRLLAQESERDVKLLLFLFDHGLKRHHDEMSRCLGQLLKTKNFKRLQFFYEKLGFDLYIRIGSSENLLFEAIFQRNIEGVQWLLEYGFQGIDYRGRTPLSYARDLNRFWPSREKQTIVEILEMYENIPTIKEPET